MSVDLVIFKGSYLALKCSWPVGTKVTDASQRREVVIMSAMQIPQTLHLQEWFYRHVQSTSEQPAQRQYCILMEFMPGGNLYYIIKHFGKLKVEYVRFYARQLAAVFWYFSYLNVMHRDVKPANVFVDYIGRVKVGCCS